MHVHGANFKENFHHYQDEVHIQSTKTRKLM